MRKRSQAPFEMLILLFLFWAVLLPLIRLLSLVGKVDVWMIVRNPQFINAAKNSMRVATVATIISVALAFGAAWSVARTGIRFKGILMVLMSVPMLVPSISHGMGLVILFGSNGVLTNLLGLNGSIYGFWGIVAGSVLYSFPVAFLMLLDVLKYEDSSPYEAATVLGIPKLRQLVSISYPYLRKPLISIVFVTFTMIITDYGVPLMIGGRYTTLPVLMYQEVIGLLDFGKGSVIGAFLLIPAFASFSIDLLTKDWGNVAFGHRSFELKKSRIRDTISLLWCGVIVLLVCSVVGSFVLITFVRRYPVDMSFTLRNIGRTFQMGGGRYLLNSIRISFLVSTIGVVAAFVAAYLTMRMPSTLSGVLHLISLSALAIPGIVLGLSYVVTFKGTVIYGKLGILVLANLVHFFSSPYLMMYNALGKINQNLEAVGATLGVSRIRIILDVILPQSRATLLEMGSYLFVNSMMTISAVSFLSTTATKPISLMINQFEAQMMLESAAFASLLILTTNVIIKLSVYAFKRHMSKKGVL